VYNTQIKSSTTDERQKSKLLDVFVDWMIQRFSELGKEEIEIMLLGKLPDLRDTQAGKVLIAIGVEKGNEKGLEKGALIGTIRTCQGLLGLEVSSETTLRSKSNEERNAASVPRLTNPFQDALTQPVDFEVQRTARRSVTATFVGCVLSLSHIC
jgi:predicted transposase YdaD